MSSEMMAAANPSDATISPLPYDRITSAATAPNTSVATFQPLPLLRILANNLERDCCVDEAKLARACIAGIEAKIEALKLSNEDKHFLLSTAEFFEEFADAVRWPQHVANQHQATAKRIREIVGCR